jgi:endoglucanase
MEYFAKDGKILNEKGERTRIKGVNWFGFETNIYTVHGLWSVSMDSLFKFLKDNRFNAIRVPVSLEMVLKMDELKSTGIDTTVNPALAGVTASKALDVFIAKCKDNGMLVLLDMHVHTASGPIEDLLWTNTYSEKDWIDGWKKLVTRYQQHPHVFACDLKNEPHGSATWAKGDPRTDWAKAAERIAAAIHNINPKLLIFVEGIENPEAPQYGSFWGGNLSDVNKYQIKLNVQNKLVYSPHVYGPTVFMQQYFNDSTFPKNMPAIWEQQFGFIKSKNIGTLVVGEWGGRMEKGSLDEIWQNTLGEWMKSKDIDSFYWSLNCNSGDTKGLVEDDWKTPVQNKLDLLAQTHPNPTVFSFGTSLPSPPTQTVPSKPQPQITNGAITLETRVVNSWNDYFLVECKVTNTTASSVIKSCQILIDNPESITQFWNANKVDDRFSFPDWIEELKPTQTMVFGFICKTKVPKLSMNK